MALPDFANKEYTSQNNLRTLILKRQKRGGIKIFIAFKALTKASDSTYHNILACSIVLVSLTLHIIFKLYCLLCLQIAF